MPENLLAVGYQYEVINLGNQVSKRLLTPDESFARFSTHGRQLLPMRKIAINAVENGLHSAIGVAALINEYPELSPTFANPQFKSNGCYIQDKVTVFGEALRNRSTKENKGLIDKYVELSLLHVSYGMMDKVCLLTENCGIDKNGKVVLIDFGEVTFDRQEAIRLARTRRWTRSQAFFYPFSKPRNFALPIELKPYYAIRMLSQFGPKAIEQTWQQSLHS